MGLIIRILMTGIVVMLLAEFLPGVAVANYWTAIIVAIILALLNFIVKPILVLFTLPITILTLGLFLLVINAIINPSSEISHGFDGVQVNLRDGGEVTRLLYRRRRPRPPPRGRRTRSAWRWRTMPTPMRPNVRCDAIVPRARVIRRSAVSLPDCISVASSRASTIGSQAGSAAARAAD